MGQISKSHTNPQRFCTHYRAGPVEEIGGIDVGPVEEISGIDEHPCGNCMGLVWEQCGICCGND